jgi:hypothetical protein
MNINQVALGQNQILSQLLLGYRAGNFIATQVLPQINSSLTTMMLARVGIETRQRYDLKRAPGTKTKMVSINYSGSTYSIANHSVSVPIPREWIEEQDALGKVGQLPLQAALKYGNLAVETASYLLGLEYEAEAAEEVLDEAIYGGNVNAITTAANKWSKDTSKPVDDISAASEAVRKGAGVMPNSMMISASSLAALKKHPQVLSKLPSTNLGMATVEQLKTVFDVQNIFVGGAIIPNADGTSTDVWGNSAIVFYNPIGMTSNGGVNMVEPVFGFTGLKKGGVYVEQPYYDNESKSWIYGASYDRSANVCSPKSGFLIKGTV